MHEVWSWGSRPREWPKRTWREVVREDCQACKLNKEDAMDYCKWRKMIKDVWWSGWVWVVWVGECLFWYWPTRVVRDQRPLNGCVWVCVCGCQSGRSVWRRRPTTDSWRHQNSAQLPVLAVETLQSNMLQSRLQNSSTPFFLPPAAYSIGGGIMFSTCTSVCACVRAYGHAIRVILQLACRGILL